jgi:hypothetical protein
MYIGTLPVELAGGAALGVGPVVVAPPTPVIAPSGNNWERYVEWVQDYRYSSDQHIHDAAYSIAEVMQRSTSYQPYAQFIRTGGRIKLCADVKSWVLLSVHVAASHYGIPLPAAIDAICSE